MLFAFLNKNRQIKNRGSKPGIFWNELANKARVQPKKRALVKTSVSCDVHFSSFFKICVLYTLINSSLVMNFGWLSYTIPQFWKRGFSQRGSRAYYSKAGLFSVGEWRDSIWEIYHTAITWFKAVLGGFPYCRTAHPLWVPWTSGDLSVLMTPGGIPLLNHHWGVTSAGKVIINCTDSMTPPKKPSKHTLQETNILRHLWKRTPSSSKMPNG